MVWDSSLILTPSRQRIRSLFMPYDRRAAPLPCTIPGGCQRLVVATHVCLDACLLKARLSQGLSSVSCLSCTSCGPPTAFPSGHQCIVGVLPATGVPLSSG